MKIRFVLAKLSTDCRRYSHAALLCRDVVVAHVKRNAPHQSLFTTVPAVRAVTTSTIKTKTTTHVLTSTTTTSTTTTTTEAKMLSTKFEDLVFHPTGHKQTTQLNAVERERIDCEYEEALKTLNLLQPNQTSLRNSISGKHDTIEETVKYLEYSGLTLEQVERQLSIIHVTGTKGKGSTCALIESILRAHGARTGFFSSPHIVAITERVRIDGEPLGKEQFTRIFWRVYKALAAKFTQVQDMPAYFKFLTILSFHVFIEAKVDVAILEVGIGGELDSTNVIRNTKTVGICSLGLEHTALLGRTLTEIAWQKGGIIKPGANVYTQATQPECLAVLEQRAKEKHAQLYRVPALREYYEGTKYAQDLAELNDVVLLNGSLAIQLACDWLRRQQGALHRDYVKNGTQLSDELVYGLNHCHWPGRCQRVEYLNMRIHLDGAHTAESLCVCADWFAKMTKNSTNPKILIFNRTGDTDTRPLLDVLRSNFRFDHVCFAPNRATSRQDNPKDIDMLLTTGSEKLQRAEFHAANWRSICAAADVPHNSQVYLSLTDVFEDLRCRWPPSEQQLDVLITGSVHLIGSVVCALNSWHVPPETAGDGNGDIVSNDVKEAPIVVADTSAKAASKSKHSTQSAVCV